MVYIVEDEQAIRDLVVYSLKNTGYDCKGFASSEEFFAGVKNEKPDMAILDIMLPGEDGLSILKKIRSMKTIQEIPVIMLTAKTSEYDKVVGLDLGADDYMTKPFGIMELIARVKTMLRRAKKSSVSAEKLVFKSIEVDIARHLVSVSGKEITLTLKEFDLLAYLIQGRNIVYSRENLLAAVWGYDFAMETRTIDAHIMSLRSKLGDEVGKYIQTVRGVGYKIGDIE